MQTVFSGPKCHGDRHGRWTREIDNWFPIWIVLVRIAGLREISTCGLNILSCTHAYVCLGDYHVSLDQVKPELKLRFTRRDQAWSIFTTTLESSLQMNDISVS